MERKQNRREFLKNMGVLGLGALLPNLPLTELNDVSKDWEQFQFGDQVFGVAKGQSDLYSDPDINGPKVINRVVNTYPDTSDILWSPRYEIMHGTTLRLLMVDGKDGGKWGQIQKENGIYTPFISPDTSGRAPENLYVNLNDFDSIPQLTPISVLADTN